MTSGGKVNEELEFIDLQFSRLDKVRTRRFSVNRRDRIKKLFETYPALVNYSTQILTWQISQAIESRYSQYDLELTQRKNLENKAEIASYERRTGETFSHPLNPDAKGNSGVNIALHELMDLLIKSGELQKGACGAVVELFYDLELIELSEKSKKNLDKKFMEFRSTYGEMSDSAIRGEELRLLSETMIRAYRDWSPCDLSGFQKTAQPISSRTKKVTN